MFYPFAPTLHQLLRLHGPCIVCSTASALAARCCQAPFVSPTTVLIAASFSQSLRRARSMPRASCSCRSIFRPTYRHTGNVSTYKHAQMHPHAHRPCAHAQYQRVRGICKSSLFCALRSCAQTEVLEPQTIGVAVERAPVLRPASIFCTSHACQQFILVVGYR